MRRTGVPPIVIQIPPTSIWGQLLPALVGVFGAVLGVLVTAWATRNRERGQYVWERRANLYLELLRDVRTVDDAVHNHWHPNDDYQSPDRLTFQDPARFEELALYCSHVVVNKVRYYHFEYEEWRQYHDDWGSTLLLKLGNQLRSEAAYDLRVRRYRRKDRADYVMDQVYSWRSRTLRLLKKPYKAYRNWRFWRDRTRRKGKRFLSQCR